MQYRPNARRVGHARALSAPRRYGVRVLVAAALAALVALPGLLASPTQAGPTLESAGSDEVVFDRVEGRIGPAILNDSPTDRTTAIADHSFFGVVRGMSLYDSRDRNQYSQAHQAGVAQRWLKADVAKRGDYWSYITRGVAWDYHINPYGYQGEYRDNVISASTTSALGYKPNNPGKSALNSTFLIGTVRHNNFPIWSAIHYVHASFDIRIGDLEESFPFDQHETTNDNDTTAVAHQGGAYRYYSQAYSARSCPTNAPYYALIRGYGENTWFCFQHVGPGYGNYDIYTDQPNYYPNYVDVPGHTPESDDVLTVNKTTSDRTLVVDGIPYRLFLWGFVPSADGNCPAQPPADSEPVNTFTTKENQTSFGCLYGEFRQERFLRIAKNVTEDSGAPGEEIPAFNFTTLPVGNWKTPEGAPLPNEAQADTYISPGSFSDFSLTPTAYGDGGTVMSGYQSFIPGKSQFIVAETGPTIPGKNPIAPGQPGYYGPWPVSDDPNAAQWKLSEVTCVNGVGDRVNVTRDPATGGIDFSAVPPASSAKALPVTCTFTNQKQAPKIRIEKSIESVKDAFAPNITVTYRITATNDGTLKGTTGRLSDSPSFAPGLKERSVRIATTLEGLDSATPTRYGPYTLTEGTDLEPGAQATWYIRMNVARNKKTPGYNEAALECASDNGHLTPRRGLYNSVSGPYDYDGSANNEACAPVRPRYIRIEKAGTQPVGTPNDDGTYPLKGAAFAIYDNAELEGTPVSVVDGGPTFLSAPLAPDTNYWLVETRAPAGHALLPRPVPFRISVGTDADATTVLTTEFGPDEGFSSVRVLPAQPGVSGEAGAPGIRIVDTQVGTLPVAGGYGVYPHVAAGIGLIALAGGCVWARRRQRVGQA